MIEINKTIDQTLLKPDARKEDIAKLCEEAIKYQFKSVCVQPTHVSYAKSLLSGSKVLVCTVIGFPLGANITKVKVFETQCAIDQGADEIDMVINIGALKENNLSLVEEDIIGVVTAAKKRCVKVIIESCLLTDKEIIYACEAASKAGADFVKTSTGFSTSGASLEAVKIMKESIPMNMQVKASGGIRSYKDAKAYLDQGAERLGTSSGIKIMQEYKTKTDVTPNNSDDEY